ncbi:MAG: hypothetical protein ACOYOU_06075 [Kiritimatiellia bacterium]
MTPSEAFVSTEKPSAIVKQAPVSASAVGKSAQTLLAAAARDKLRIEYFTSEGKLSAGMPASGGSVSIHHASGNGQDNYTFGVDGRVTRHMRSVGANYQQGKWEISP